MQNYSPGKNRLLSLGGLGTATQEDRLVPFPGRKSSVLNLLQTAEKWVNTSDRASLYDEFPLHDSMILSNESLFILKVEHCKRHFPPWCIHHPLVRVPSSQTEPRSHQRLVSPLPSTQSQLASMPPQGPSTLGRFSCYCHHGPRFLFCSWFVMQSPHILFKEG